jgi:putative addiction module component (TIGR02574 family)
VSSSVELIGELWDSIPDSVEAMPVPDWHREELERRLAAADAEPEAAIPWEDVKRRLRLQPDRIEVIAVLHGSRDPRLWQKRVNSS